MSLFKKAGGDPNAVKDATFYRQEAERHRNEYMASLKLMGRMIILAGASLAILAVTLAWYANNHRTDAGGMSTNTQVTPNLVIAKDEAGIQSPDPSGLFEVVLESSEGTLIPARHKEGSDYPVNLEYNRYPRRVSPVTGMKKEGADDLAFAPVPEVSDEQYFFEQTVFIASTGMEMDADALTVSMELVGASEQEYLQAASIDFYVNGNYVDTLNAAGKTWNDISAAKTSVTLWEDPIPLNTDGYITVMMRCYYDGGLEKEAGTTYVRSNGLAAEELRLKVTFRAVE